jgi:DNA-directed RNA polymerase subunit RPC12/RpoP
MDEVPKPRFKCGQCGTRYAWKPEIAGKKVKCQCGTMILVPANLAPAPVPAASAPAPAPAKAAAPAPPAAEENRAMLGLEEDEGEAEPEEAALPTRGGKAAKSSRARSAAPGGASAPVASGDTWKWWYYIVAGALIGALSVYELISGGQIIRFGRGKGPVGGLILAALCIAVGLFSRPKKT